MKTISIGDLHGNEGWKIIPFDNYDRIIFLGDYCDHWTRSDAQIKNNLLAIIDLRKRLEDKVVLLYGNHDIAYIFPGNKKFFSPGFRNTMAADLQIIFQEYNELFHYAHQEGNYLWTHAGITQQYYDRDYLPLERVFLERFPEFSDAPLAGRINAIAQTHMLEAFTQRGYARGGNHARGSFLWADTSEHTGLRGYHQITGHNIVPKIRSLLFEDSSVTLVDCLGMVNDFYIKEI